MPEPWPDPLDIVEQEVKAERDAEWWADEPQYPEDDNDVQEEAT